jgi:hypothetical protein
MAIRRKNNSYTNAQGVGSVETVGVGSTVRVWSDYAQVMSDEWAQTTFATYWDNDLEALQTLDWVDSAEVDATPEVLEKVKAKLYAQALEDALEKAKAEALQIVTGSMVEVKKGRQNKGVVGKVVVEIVRPYGMGYRSTAMTKLGIATSEAKVKVAGRNGKIYENYKDVVWAWVCNCELLQVPEIDMEKVKDRAQTQAQYKFDRVAPNPKPRRQGA